MGCTCAHHRECAESEKPCSCGSTHLVARSVRGKGVVWVGALQPADCLPKVTVLGLQCLAALSRALQLATQVWASRLRTPAATISKVGSPQSTRPLREPAPPTGGVPKLGLVWARGRWRRDLWRRGMYAQF
jgi:hypothetical protein